MGQRPSVEVWEDVLFNAIQQGNANGKARKVVKDGMTISDIVVTNEESNEKIYALIPPGLTSISQVIVYERPF